MPTTRMSSIMQAAIFSAFVLSIVQPIEQEHPLDVYLKQHVRALDARRDVSAMTIPLTARQAVGDAPTCESVPRCIPSTVSCGSFKCSFCNKLRCLPSRKVNRGRPLSEITCMRTPCKKKAVPAGERRRARNCCTRNFCITNTCKPVVRLLPGRLQKYLHCLRSDGG